MKYYVDICRYNPVTREPGDYLTYEFKRKRKAFKMVEEAFKMGYVAVMERTEEDDG